MREEVEAAVKSLMKDRSPGVDNIPAELIQATDNLQQDLIDWRIDHNISHSPVVKIAEKVAGHCILSAELTKSTPSDCFLGDFAHWVVITLTIKGV